jgi:hypothetical protein
MMSESEVYQEYIDAYEDAVDEVLAIVNKHVSEDIFLKIQKDHLKISNHYKLKKNNLQQQIKMLIQIYQFKMLERKLKIVIFGKLKLWEI